MENHIVKFPWNGFNRKKYGLMESWCLETLGEEYDRWVGFRRGVNEFVFDDEEAKILFLLKWGHEIP